MIEYSAVELARRVDYILAQAAAKVGMPHDHDHCWHFRDLAREILNAAQGSLTRAEYRRIFQIWLIFEGCIHA